jgi:hypothetical protein
VSGPPHFPHFGFSGGGPDEGGVSGALGMQLASWKTRSASDSVSNEQRPQR